MIELNVTNLVGGNITITTSSSGGGGGNDTTKTRFTLTNGHVEDYEITGTLNQQWFIDHGFAHMEEINYGDE